jgi:hypothetical protein
MPGSPLSADGDDDREVGDDESEASNDESEVSDDESEADDDQSDACHDSSGDEGEADDDQSDACHDSSDDEEEGDSESFEEVHFAKEALKAMFKTGYSDDVIMANVRQSCSQWRRGKSRYPFAMARIMRQDSEREALRAHGLGKRTRAESDC